MFGYLFMGSYAPAGTPEFLAAEVVDMGYGVYAVDGTYSGSLTPAHQWQVGGVDVSGATAAYFDNKVYKRKGNLRCALAASGVTTFYSDPLAINIPLEVYNAASGDEPSVIFDFVHEQGWKAAPGMPLVKITSFSSFINGLPPYITGPTDSIQRLRANTGSPGDQPDITLSDFDFNANAWSGIQKVRMKSFQNNARLICVDAGNDTERNVVYGSGATPPAFRMGRSISSSFADLLTGPSHTPDTVENVAFAWEANNYALSVNGSGPTTQGSGAHSTTSLVRMNLMHGSGATQQPGTSTDPAGTELFRLFPKRLANSDLTAASPI